MDYEKACKIFDISINNFNLNEINIKKIYYKKALLLHPDKGGDNEKLKELNNAYIYLINHNDIDNNIKIDNKTNKYSDILFSIIKNIVIKYNDTLFVEFLNNINKDNAIEIYNFILDHNDIFNINDDILIIMKNIIHKKIQNHQVIILNPTIHDIINDNIFKLNTLNSELLIPLWHHELYYDISYNNIIVKCEPILDENMFIDNKNNLYINITKNINDLLSISKFNYVIGNKTFEIMVNKLYISDKPQEYIIKNKGILSINENNIYDNTIRGNVIFNILLSFNQ